MKDQEHAAGVACDGPSRSYEEDEATGPFVNERARVLARAGRRAPGIPPDAPSAYTRPMSRPAPNRRPMTVEEYLAFEAAAEVKHEYVAGEVYAMSGVTRRHARIITNLIFRLRLAARGSPCDVLSEVKFRPRRDRFYYPDLLVVCTPGDDDAVVVRDPCLVIEVTSPSTARIDRGEKLDAYRKSAPLRAYLIVDHRRRRVERHWRDPDAPRGAGYGGGWRREELTGEGRIPLPCPEVALSLDEIFEGVELTVGEEEAEYQAAEG
jgi:Uma2 family endonuclease